MTGWASSDLARPIDDAAENKQDLEGIASMHDETIAFHNHTECARTAAAPATHALLARMHRQISAPSGTAWGP